MNTELQELEMRPVTATGCMSEETRAQLYGAYTNFKLNPPVLTSFSCSSISVYLHQSAANDFLFEISIASLGISIT